MGQSCNNVRVRASGFTLVEILIVVVILGILATIVIPQFSNASQEARENTLKDDLRYLRVQIQVFKAQHRDVPPGYPNMNLTALGTDAAFVDQMTHYSSEAGVTSPTGSADVYKFGPYLSKMPDNPINGKTNITVVANGAAIPAATGSSGWIYKPETQELYPNLTGNDTTGMAYSKY